MAFRLGLGDQFSRHDAASAGPVVNEHGLPQIDGQLLRHGARGQVGYAPCAKRHHDAQGFGGENGLCPGHVGKP
jgi:hypothetical protein